MNINSESKLFKKLKIKFQLFRYILVIISAIIAYMPFNFGDYVALIGGLASAS